MRNQRKYWGIALLPLAAVLAIAGCDGAGGDEAAEVTGPSTADRAAESGRDGSINRGLGLYPGSRPGGAPDRFATSDPIDRVVEWYRDDRARRSEMMFVSTERQDDGYLVIGTAGEEGKSFALKLTPRSGGGTETELLPYDPNKGL